MMAFIEQEASEKVEEIDAKVMKFVTSVCQSCDAGFNVFLCALVSWFDLYCVVDTI